MDDTSQMTLILQWLRGPVGMGFAVVWGAIWGSFFNVVIARLPLGRSVVHPPSSCLACGARVRAFDNVPVLSYLWLRGRCRACGAHFSVRYPLIEGVTAALTAGLWWAVVVHQPGMDMDTDLAWRLGRFTLYFAFVGLLLILAAIDLDTKRLPDVLTIPGALGLFVAAFAVRDVGWSARAIGLAAGYLFVRLIADFYYYVLKREGLGLGDGKLLALIGGVLGWTALAPVIFGASVLGTVIAVPTLLLRRSAARRRARSAAPPPAEEEIALRHVEIPFGPFLALAAVGYLGAYLVTGEMPATWLWPGG